MARTVTIQERDFAPGQYSRSVDSFPADVEELRVTITRVNWPGATSDTVATLNIAWETGEGARFGLPGGQLLDKQGQPINTQVLRITVPRDADGSGGRRKRNQVGGTATLEVVQALRAALTVEAL